MATHVRIRPGMVVNDIRVPRKGVERCNDHMEAYCKDVSLAEKRSENEGEDGGDGYCKQEVTE